MTPTPQLAALLLLAACAPAGPEGAAAGDAERATVPVADAGPGTAIDRNVTDATEAGPDSRPVAVPVADVDPVTGIDRNVTYEPQVGPEMQERERSDPPESQPKV